MVGVHLVGVIVLCSSISRAVGVHLVSVNVLCSSISRAVGVQLVGMIVHVGVGVLFCVGPPFVIFWCGVCFGCTGNRKRDGFVY